MNKRVTIYHKYLSPASLSDLVVESMEKTWKEVWILYRSDT